MITRRTWFMNTCTFSTIEWAVISLVLLQQLFLASGYGDFSHKSYNSPRSGEVVVDAVEAPYPVRMGQTVQLKCLWRVGSKGFYSLRWYKDEVQFYSLIRGEEGNAHQVDGVHVILQESDDHVVTLRGVTSKAEGTYKCEIMSDGPKFKISQGSANLTVVELPETPQLLGLKHRYMAGDTLNVTCRASNGRPAPTIVFRVNDIPIHEESGRVKQLPSTLGDRPGVFTSNTVLEMPLGESLHPNFKLGCYAYAHGLKVQKEVSIQVTHRRTFFSLFGGSSSDTTTGSGILAFIPLITSVIVIFRWKLPGHL